MLSIYNSLTRRKEVFQSIVPGKVRMYVCGMTVYDYCHLGHARMMVVFDMVYRYLSTLGYDVTYVRNITDIDDKIIKRAAENGEPIDALTERFIRFMHEDAGALGVIRPTQEPRATQHIPQIIAMIEALLNRGHAYQAANGDVYYDVSSFLSYGKLSGKKVDELRVGARVEVDEAKDDPLDFVLWKTAKPDEPQWESPFGPGRPGWHIECSAMATHCLGNEFDIHGGGQDLQFPHHENEIAQSEGATCAAFAHVWIHNGFIRVDDEKMSKSLGNFFTVREVLQRYRPEEVRYFILTSHYRSPLNYSEENLDNARNALQRLYLAMRGLLPMTADGSNPFIDRFHAAMDDDFNTPEALAVLFDLAREINKARSEDDDQAGRLVGTLSRLGEVLGLLREEPEAYLRGGTSGEHGALNANEIQDLIDAREAARKRKDWQEADRLRAQLLEAGVVLEDKRERTQWRRV